MNIPKFTVGFSTIPDGEGFLPSTVLYNWFQRFLHHFSAAISGSFSRENFASKGRITNIPPVKGRKAGKIIIFKSGLLMGYVTSLEGSHLKSLRTLGESLRTDAAPELPELRAGLRDWALASMPENNQTFLSPKAS